MRSLRSSSPFALSIAILFAIVVPIATAQTADAPPKAEKIKINDVLTIIVHNQPKLSRSVIVAEDGTISLPLINSVTAAGLSAKELENVVAERLKAYVKSPQVAVAVQSGQGYRIRQFIRPPRPIEVPPLYPALSS